jgi:hypothetical protein
MSSVRDAVEEGYFLAAGPDGAHPVVRDGITASGNVLI